MMDQFGHVNRPAPEKSREWQGTATGSFSHQRPWNEGISVLKGPKREEGDKFVPNDPMFRILSGMFSEGTTHLSYNAALTYMRTYARLRITPWIPPRITNTKWLCLTTTRRLFEFQAPVVPVLNANGDGTKGYTVTHELGIIANGSFYDTCKKTPDDERMRVLAYYIIQKFKAHTIDEVINALACWASININLFNIGKKFDDLKTNTELVPTEEIAQDLDVRVNHSFSNGAEIIRKGGVCQDFANLLSDLLNSIGIPARPVMVSWLGVESKNRETIPISDAHAFVEVHLNSTEKIYVDAMPVESPDGIFGFVRLGKNAKELFETFLLLKNPNLTILNMQITGAMPLEFITPELMELLEGYPATYARQPAFLGVFYEFLAKYGDDYWIHFMQNL